MSVKEERSMGSGEQAIWGRRANWEGLDEVQPKLRRFLARRCRDEHEVEDVIQETLVRAARFRHRLGDGERLQGWAISIAANVLRDHIRKESRLRRQDLQVDPDQGADPMELLPEIEVETPRVPVDGKWVEKDLVLRELGYARAELRSSEQRVLHSHYDLGASCSETARVCEVPEDLVKVRLFRARRQLLASVRSRLKQLGDGRGPRPRGCWA